jgi:two-component system, NarL family, invasion response regulator UvrY
MYKFLIVEDHNIFRQGVKKIISDEFEEVLFCEAANSAEALTKLNKETWDLVILDINMPGRSGLDLIHDVKSFNPGIPVLVLSMYEEDQMALRALKAGASGYLTKTRAAEDMIFAITRILEGNDYINESVAALLVCEYRNEKTGDAVKHLSDREYFVLLRLAAGETVTEISRTLTLSVKTISTYRTRIMRKLNLKNMVELIRFVKDKNIGKKQ